MPEIILSESNQTLNALYGDFQAPIVSHIEELCEAWQEQEIAPLIFREQKIMSIILAFEKQDIRCSLIPQ